MADKKPDYVFTSGYFCESVWTYLGRCQYHLGKLADARFSFDRALVAVNDDYLGRVSWL